MALEPQEGNLAPNGIPPGVELALLVELSIVRKKRFWNDAKQVTSVDHQAAVEKFSFETQRCPDEQHRPEIFAVADDSPERLLGRIEQNVLMEKIIVGIRGNSQLRKKRYGRAVVPTLHAPELTYVGH